MQCVHLWEGPADGHDEDVPPCYSVTYDLRDSGSIRRAERALQRQLGLRAPPVLCNEPPLPILSRVKARVVALWPRLHRPIHLSRRVPTAVTA